MADAERSKAEGEVPGKPIKRREELDQLLQRIAAHIAEVDAVDSPTSGGPTPRAAAADSVETAERQGDALEAADPKVEPDREGGSGDRSRSGASLRRKPLSVEPPALRSALSGNKPASGVSVSPSRHGNDQETPEADSKPLESASRPTEDEADGSMAIESREAQAVGGNAGAEPWDDVTAEALTRTYETDLAVPPLRSMLEAMGGPAGGSPERRGSERRLAPADRAFDSGGAVSATDVDVAQAGLLNAARRVEALLDRLAPREAVDALGARFSTLEGEVERAGAQLQRLDGIETRLGELGQKLTDEQIVTLFGSLVPTAEDLTQFAEDAAGRAAERVLEAYSQELSVQAAPRAPTDAVANVASASQMKALSELLAAFMDERRRNDVGTLEALETLQLAMQHVLDRIDRVEDVLPHDDQETGQGSRHAPMASMSYEPAALAAKSDELPEGLVNLTANQGGRDLQAHSYRMPDDRAPDLDTIPDARGYDERSTLSPEPRDRQTDALAATLDMPIETAQRLRGHQSSAPVAVDDPAPAQPMTDRQAFIAMARKAAERAKAEAEGPAKGEAGKPGKSRVAGDLGGKAASSGSSVGIIRPGVIIIAVGAILFAGYWFLIGQKSGLPRVLTPTVSERVEPAAVQSSNGAKPDLEKDEAAPSPANAAPAIEAPARPSNTSDDTPTAPAADQQEASAAPAGDVTGPGMAIAFGPSSANFDAVMQARERARLANLSQRTAFTAARSHGIPHGPAPDVAKDVSSIETASVASDSRVSQEPAQASAPTSLKSTTQQLILPPAAAGPLSLRLAAAQGDASAQLEIATRLAEGKGVKQSFAEAATWYERAAVQGQPIAQYRLATLYERGMGVKADRNRARTLYEQAAEQGNLKAMHNLAVISASPASGRPDYDTAATLFNRAAGHGLADSQYNLGVLYESGLGVPKDHAAAYKWYTLAARGGDADAARRRDSLISRLPAETLQAMDRQIAAWRPAPADEQANNARVAGSSWKQRKAATAR